MKICKLDIDAAMLGPTQTHALSLVETSTSPHKDVPHLGDWKPGSGNPDDVGSGPPR